MIIVDTKDSVLISHRNNVGEVKKILKKVKDSEGEKSNTVQKPLVTILIPTDNDHKYIEDTLVSAFKQTYKNIEYIVLDNGSTDGTRDVINRYRYKIEHLYNLPSTGLYTRINKGILEANGKIVTVLRPDNMYFDTDSIDSVVGTMEQEKTDVCWGDMIYLNDTKSNKISMYWQSSQYKSNLFQKGWSPPFPTFFARKSIYKKYGAFNQKLHIAADYELMLRLLEKHHVKSSYISKILVKMVGRGITTKNMYDKAVGNLETHKAWELNGLQTTQLFLIQKNITRFSQIWSKNRN